MPDTHLIRIGLVDAYDMAAEVQRKSKVEETMAFFAADPLAGMDHLHESWNLDRVAAERWG